ncbi:MAG TPA: hypothetical protein VFU06_16360 [Longimicrobiales bacterium]|nr:hypothetical protein [Longimicrobiales bacterium]
MARYDRIAALPLPPRTQAIPGWCVLRELNGRERDTELANRMRLFFLALRPVRRLVDRGFDVPFDSHDRQIAAVRAVLDTMPASALEQARLRSFLNAVGTRVPERVALAALDVSAMAEARSHYEAATEFAHTALAAGAHANPGVEARACTSLARLARKSGRWHEAEEWSTQATERAAPPSFRAAWANAVTELATLYHVRGDQNEAARLLAGVRKRVAEWKDELLLADGAEALAATALAAGHTEVAVHEGWFALHRINDIERRRRLLISIADGLRLLRLYDGADACYGALAQSAIGSAERAAPLTRAAVSAAESGDAAGFRDRHDRAMREVLELHDGQRAGFLLELGRACVLAGDAERGLAHANATLNLADAHGDPRLKSRAQELCTVAAAHHDGVILAGLHHPPAPADDTRELAAEIAAGALRVVTQARR